MQWHNRRGDEAVWRIRDLNHILIQHRLSRLLYFNLGHSLRNHEYFVNRFLSDLLRDLTRTFVVPVTAGGWIEAGDPSHRLRTSLTGS